MRSTGIFSFGKAFLAIACLAVACGLWLAFHPVQHEATKLRLWVFSKEHREAYLKALPAFLEQHPGITVEIQLVSNQAMPTRMLSAFLADADVPDLVEIEITNAGIFFRGPIASVGFVDLTDRIKQSGLWDRVVRARFAPYTKEGRIFGLPHDVHPVMIAYNRVAFEELGIDPAKIATWDDYIREGRRVTRVGGNRPQYLMELLDSNYNSIEALLFQRGGGYFDPEGRVIFDNDAAVETMKFFVPLVTGPKQIGSSLTTGLQVAQALEGRYFLSLLAPDWRTRIMEKDAAHMGGKMALMPLPAVKPGGSRTSTWGGTMIGITRKSPRQDLAWQLAVHLYFNPADLAKRFHDTNILPPLKAVWQQPDFDERRPYWSNEALGRKYADLAPEVPFQYSSPFSQLAKDKLGEALVRCGSYYRAHGEEGFEAACRRELKASADEIRRLAERNPYK